MARVLYSTNIGMIPDESFVIVKSGDVVIGKIDEAFLERLKKRDIFVLGGKTYQFRYASGQTAQVIPAAEKVPTVPSWFSDQLPLSFGLAMEIQRFRKLMEEQIKSEHSKEDIIKFINSYLYVDENSANSIYEYFREQYLYAEIPNDKKIVIEFYQSFSKKKYVIFHTLFGRRVNDVLSRAIGYLISVKQRKDINISLTDNGFYLSAGESKIQVLQALELLKTYDLWDLMTRAVDKTEVLSRRFRHCATRSLMILREYKGRRKSVGRQQIGSKILLKFVKAISQDFPILKEARREVLEDLMDIESAKKIIMAINNDEIKIKTISTDIPSPFAFNLIARGYMDILKMSDRMEFIRAMHKAVLERIKEK